MVTNMAAWHDSKLAGTQTLPGAIRALIIARGASSDRGIRQAL